MPDLGGFVLNFGIYCRNTIPSSLEMRHKSKKNNRMFILIFETLSHTVTDPHGSTSNTSRNSARGRYDYFIAIPAILLKNYYGSFWKQPLSLDLAPRSKKFWTFRFYGSIMRQELHYVPHIIKYSST